MSVVEGTAKVRVDGVDAGQVLEKLEKKAADFKRQLVELRKQDILDNKKIKDIEGQLRQVNNEMRDVKAQTTSYNTVLKNLSGASLKELQKAYKQLSIETNKLKRGTDEYKASASNLSRIKSEIAKVKAEMNGARVSSKGFGASLKSMAGTLFAGGGLIAGFYALVGIIKNAFSIFTDFSKAGSKLQAIMGLTKDEMKALNDQEKKLGATTAYTATQVTELQTELAKLGFSKKEILDSTGAILSLAAATGSELAPAAELAGATLRIFNLDASEMNRVSDVLAKSTTKSSLSMEKLATILPTVGKTAQIAGVSLEKTVALAGTLTDRGLDASTAATSLRNIFLELSNKGLTWNEAMQQINASTDKNKTAMDLFGTRAAAAGVILSETSESVENLTVELEKSAGAAQKMADVMLDNLSGDLTKAQSAWEGFILSLEDGNGPLSKILRKVTQTGTGVLNMMTTLNTEYGSNAEKAHEMNKAAEETIPLWNMQLKTLEYLIPSLRGMKDATEAQYEAEQKHKKFIGGYISQFEKYKKALEDQAKAAEESANKVKVLTEEQKAEAKKAYEEMMRDSATFRAFIESVNVALIADDKERAIAEVELWNKQEISKIESSKAANKIKSEAIEAQEKIHKQKLLKIQDDYNKKLIDQLEKIEDFIYEQNAQFETNRDQILTRDIKAIRDKYDKQIEVAREAAEKDSNLKEQFAQAEIELEKQKANEIAAYKKKKEKEFAEETYQTRQKYGLITSKEQFERERNELKEAYEKNLLTREEYERADKDLVLKYENEKFQLRKNLGVTSIYEELAINLENLKQLYDKGIIEYSDFVIAQGIAISEAYKSITDEVTSIFSDFFTNQKNEDIAASEYETNKRKEELEKQKKDKLKSLDDQLKAGKITDEQYAEYKETLEENLAEQEEKINQDSEERKKEINKQYADKEFFVTASRIVADTASAAIKAYAMLGPVAGAVAAALVTTFGIAQLANANKERERVKGLEDGDYFPVTREQDGKQFMAKYGGGKRGFINKPTVLVGEYGKTEFVVSSKSLQHPGIKRTVSAIDAYQKGHNFNYTRVLDSMNTIKGFEQGGTFGTASSGSGTGTGTTPQSSQASIDIMYMLLDEFRAFRQAIETWQSELEVYVLIQKIRDGINEIESLETEVRLG